MTTKGNGKAQNLTPSRNAVTP